MVRTQSMVRFFLLRIAALPLLLTAAGFIIAGGAQAASDENVMTLGEEGSIVRGAKLYDKWWAEAGLTKPDSSHPSYPAVGEYAGTSSDWRCKECHGWDYKGAKGAYSEGKHHTGITGIMGSYSVNPEDIVAVLKNAVHAYGDKMSEADFADAALFVSKGTIDMDQHIDRASKSVKSADPARGKSIYQTICANCHGLDGAHNEDGEPIDGDTEALGGVARGNPWETLHKIRFGQPDENMPALLAFDLQTSLDVLAFLQTLPDVE